MKARKANGQFTKEPPIAYTTAEVTQRAKQLEGAITYLAGQLTVWTYRDQLGNLDKYLDRLHWDPKLDNLRQYREFSETVKAAALILRANPAVPQLPAPGEFSRPLTERELGPHPSSPLPAGDWAFTVTVPADASVPDKVDAIMARLDDAWKDEGVFSDPDEQGAQWRPVDVPVPDADADSPQASSTEDPPPGASGAGTQDDPDQS